ncbi:hypothetical protein Dtur_1287 [Dictyoglomus turgidum DSM 6724]|uniref:Uncharacterized protein n=1 Tax=Dictyoglomus turgidum (strain DSM 6724 / Z-1310) TaxID=515635 RepID=B8E0C0_DICTD|nr:hypothetical protein Dtur_1287 [Dictyoglomus turgidum DSM 6724]HBU32232.1 hypothetical protein [Dictyoglomus sp.]
MITGQPFYPFFPYTKLFYTTGYAVDPLKYARKLISQKIGTYRFRIGDYRVIFDKDIYKDT